MRVATWNLGDLGLAADEKVQRAIALFADASDVIALQESDDPGRALTADDGTEWQGVYEHSNAILSRWPILQSGLVAANPAWARDLPWADIQPPVGPAFRVYSVHLTFKRGGNPFIGAARAVEIRRILIHAQGFAGPVIIAGDLNTVGWILGGQASEPTIRLLKASGYVDAFGAVGGRTQAVLGRLDWIYTRGFGATNQVLGNYDGSDHRWLQASLSVSDAPAADPPPTENDDLVTLLSFAGLGLLSVASWRKRKQRIQLP